MEQVPGCLQRVSKSADDSTANPAKPPAYARAPAIIVPTFARILKRSVAYKDGAAGLFAGKNGFAQDKVSCPRLWPLTSDSDFL